MLCPFCSHHIAATWQTLVAPTDEVGRVRNTPLGQIQSSVPINGARAGLTVNVLWLICQNIDCQQIVVQVVRVQQKGKGITPDNDTWLAVPKVKAPPQIDAVVPESMRKDYIEANIILDDSPRMSAVLSRRILADLLKKYDSATQYGLTARIEAFIKNSNHPSRLRENLHYLREIADFAAHTQTKQNVTGQAGAQPDPNATAPQEEEIIDATREEAEWTLKVVADLFDYFIIAPQKDEALRKSFDEKLQAAGRKPIR
jgi:hypothetical protein